VWAVTAWSPRERRLDEMNNTKTGPKQARAEKENLAKSNDLKKLEKLIVKMKSEKKRIKDLLL
jgi:hypothetical protein